MQKFVFYLFAISFLNASAQVSIKDSCVTIPMIGTAVTFQKPAGDLADRFGNNANFGFSFLIKDKNNWMYGVDWYYLFGKDIKENTILDSLTTSDGYILNKNGEYAEVRLYERGFNTSLKFGKLFNVLSANPNSGLFALAGLGVLQHKIRIEDIGNQSPQLSPEYRKGYDRMSNGLSASLFAGYCYFGNNKLVNFYMGFEYLQAWTKSRRSYDYDLMKQDTRKRNDILYGFRAGWVLPLYKRAPQKYYYY